MDVKDIILAASIAKGAGGGSGGGVTKDYVDSQVGAVSERVDDVEDVIPSTATAQNKLATSADVLAVTTSATSTTSPLSDSADGMVQGVTIYGRSEVVDGEIKSVGDNGLTVTTANSDNTLTTSAEFTTALPLRSTLDGATRDELIIGNGKAEVITRCEVVDDSIVPLATPVTTPLTSTEICASRSLRTYDSTTNITISDEPDFEFDYLKNSDNGQAVADIQKELQEQINEVSSDTTKVLSEAEILAQINDRIYQGVDLTQKFAAEIVLQYNNDPWAWIKARIQAENFAGIHVGDYIPFTTTNGITLNAQIAGINTYKNYGDSLVGAHIDFICKELWPTLHLVNPVNFNNGTAAQNYPWLASDLYLYLNSLAGTAPSVAEVGGGTGTAVDYTADGVYYYLPTQLKDVIIEKRFLLPKRYSASGLLSDDNNWGWVNIGKLWLPDECEVYGMPVWGGKGGYSLGGSALQYPLFARNMNRLKFRNGGRNDWWLLSPYSGNSTLWCGVGDLGYCNYRGASGSGVAVPVCFRVG